MGVDGDDGPALPVEVRALREADTSSPIPGAAMPDGYGGYQRFRGLFEQSPVPMAIIDLATRTSYPNAAYLTLFGYDRPGLPALDATRVTHPDDRDASDEAFRRLAHGEVESLEVDKRYVRADGSELAGHLSATVLRDAEGEPWALLTVIHDLSDRIRAEQVLADSERRLRALVDNITDAVIVLDADGRITYHSPSAARLIGRDGEDRRGSSPFEWVHPDDADQVLRSFLETADRPGPAPPLRFRVVRADGSLRLVEAVASNRLDDPAVDGVVVTMRDRTDHERVETALEVSETRFRRMLENISDTVTLVGADGHIIATTGNVREILGYPPEFWTARNAFELVHPDDVHVIQGLLEELLARPGAEVMGEFRTRNSSGEEVDVEGSAVNLLDDPSVGAIVITSRNITPRKQIERELAAARDAAVRELGIRNEFIASVSHELRTPIHGILGLTELLATTELDDGTMSLVRAIGRATESLKMVLDDLLDFTKIEAGRLEVIDEPVVIAELLSETATLYRPQATAKGVALLVELAEDLPTLVRTDGFRLRQVVANLVANAVKFTTAGEVVVRADRVASDAGDLQLRIVVSDTGVGMSPAVLDRVFEPFSQAHASTSREFGGTGLGLAISRRITELLGGTLAVRSEEGVGSTFTVRLPVEAVDRDARRPTRPAAPAERARHGDRVLVVEDNSVNQLLIRHQLERLGFEPEVVGGGAEALERFARRRPAVVLMDCQMPVMDGFATTRRLRSLERSLGDGRTPVIALTANALPGERARCLEAGMDDYLAKPVGLDALGAALAAWLQPSEPGDVAAAVEDQPGTGSAVDLDRLWGLVEEVGDREVVVAVVSTFLDELDGRLAAIERAAGHGDGPALVAAAHLLRGASAVVGATSLAATCAAIELDPDGALGERLEQLRRDVGEAAQELDRWRAAATPPAED